MLGGWSPIGPGPISMPLPGFAPVLPCEEHLQQLLTVIPGGKGPVLIGSLSIRLAGPTRMVSAYTVDEGNSVSPRSCSPLFPLFLLQGRGSLIPSDPSGGVDSSPRGNLQRRSVYGGGLISVSKSIRFRPVRGFLEDWFWALILLGFLWGSGGFHKQGLYIRRIREFVNKRL